MRHWLAVVSVAVVVLLGVTSAQAQQPPDGFPAVIASLGIAFPLAEEDPTKAPPPRPPILDVLRPDGLRGENPWEGRWRTYADAEPAIVAAAERLWNTGWFESVWVDVQDVAHQRNGVVDKAVIFNMVYHPKPDNQPTVPEGFESPPDGHERLFPR